MLIVTPGNSHRDTKDNTPPPRRTTHQGSSVIPSLKQSHPQVHTADVSPGSKKRLSKNWLSKNLYPKTYMHTAYLLIPSVPQTAAGRISAPIAFPPTTNIESAHQYSNQQHGLSAIFRPTYPGQESPAGIPGRNLGPQHCSPDLRGITPPTAGKIRQISYHPDTIDLGRPRGGGSPPTDYRALNDPRARTFEALFFETNPPRTIVVIPDSI